MNTAQLNALWGHHIIDELVQQGLDYFVVSPGSRSTPLTVAIARHPQTRHTVAYDERGAAFHALGYARATGKAAVLVCTSGTAAANYFPAIVEANVDYVPMLVLSADRPPELRHTMANQTIEQQNLFGRNVRWFFDMPTPTPDITTTALRTTIAQAAYRTMQPAGPVHINCMFREPLTELTINNERITKDSDQNSAVSDQPFSIQNSKFPIRNSPITRYALSYPTAPVDNVVDCVQNTERGIITVGQLKSRDEQRSVLELAQTLNWPVFPDTTSGLRLGTAYPQVIHHFDLALLSTNVPAPDTVLHVGGQMVSKRLLQFLERVRPKNHIVIKPTPERHDPAHSVTLRVQAEISPYLSTLIHSISHVIHNNNPQWLATWQRFDQIIEATIEQNVITLPENDTVPLTELSTARLLSQQAVDGHCLWIASSMPIRDIEMFADGKRAWVPIMSNRGASGIDGTIASALGWSVGWNRPITLLIGDLSFIHDLSSLSQLANAPHPMTIVLVNNQGGGIFHMLPISQQADVFEPFFGTPHPYQFQQAAGLFRLDYANPTNQLELVAALKQAQHSSNHTLIEVNTNRAENKAAHIQLYETIREELKRHDLS